MKANYFTMTMLAAVIALSSCSKDDEPTTAVEAIKYDPPVVLQIEESADLSIASNTTNTNIANFVGVLDNFTLPSFRTDAEGTASGPTICSNTPKATLDKKAFTYTFTYDFPKNSGCKFEGKDIFGKLNIVIDSKKNITFNFDNFTVTEVENTPVKTITTVMVLTGLVTTMDNLDNLKIRSLQFKKLVSDVTRSSVFITLSAGKSASESITTSVKGLNKNGDLTITTDGDIKTINGTLSETYKNVLFTAKLNKLTTNKTCAEKGILTGTVTITNGKNEIVSTFSGSCDTKKLSVSNNNETKVVE